MKRSRNALRRVAAGIAMAAAVAWTGLAETVTNVRGRQREKSNLIDIYYDIEATDGGRYTVKVEIEGRTNEVTATTFTGDVGDGIAPGRNRHILWNAGADWPGKKGDVRVIVTATKQDDKHGRGVQLWEGGPYWADRNVGASRPEDAGLYFWWGDTVGYRPSGTTFGFNFAYTNSVIYTYGKSLSELQSAGWVTVLQSPSFGVDPSGVLVPSHDAAHVYWGGAWRMPTGRELSDLCSKCDLTWTMLNGVKGYVFRGRGAYASNSIFLPAAGNGVGTSLNSAGTNGVYGSSVTAARPEGYACVLVFNNLPEYYTSAHGLRHYGRPVRPVQGFTK